MEAIPLELSREVERFVLEEARLLDERRFDEWLALYARDAVYWAPTQPGQRSPREALSLFHETRELLAMRVARLARSDAHVQSPPARTLHHVAGIQVDRAHEERWTIEARSTLIVAEKRKDDVRWFAGRVFHGVRREKNRLRIVLKRVDLVDSDAPQRALAVPF